MKKVLLCIMDGVGLRINKLGNAFLNANTKTIDELLKEYPNTMLNASGEYVGLPEGQMGNSEVGHSTIGTGRVIYQSLEKINKSIKDKIYKAVTDIKQNEDIEIYLCNNLNEVVNKAHEVPKKGQVVLFSPASASFDMFKNFADRGIQFKNLVNKL